MPPPKAKRHRHRHTGRRRRSETERSTGRKTEKAHRHTGRRRSSLMPPPFLIWGTQHTGRTGTQHTGRRRRCRRRCHRPQAKRTDAATGHRPHTERRHAFCVCFPYFVPFQRHRPHGTQHGTQDTGETPHGTQRELRAYAHTGKGNRLNARKSWTDFKDSSWKPIP